MLESMVAFNLVEHFYGQHFQPPLAEAGYPRLLNQWRRPYRTTDGYLCAMPYTDAHWRRFFIAAGAPELATDKRFSDISARTLNIAVLYELAARFIASRSTSDWLETFSQLEIPASTMNRLPDLQQDAHLLATGFFETIHDPDMGALCFPGVPVKFNHSRPPVGMPPRLGQHTDEILAEIGLLPSLQKP